MGQMMTIMFVTMQIILILNTTHSQVGGTEVPQPYGQFLSAFDVMQMGKAPCKPRTCTQPTYSNPLTPPPQRAATTTTTITTLRKTL